MKVTDKKFLVFGSGISGISAVELLREEGLDVILYDGNENLKEEEVRKKSEALVGIPIVLGLLPKEIQKEIDILVLSPGVPVDLPLVKEMKEQGVLIWGEIELAYFFGKGKILAITGTNGKTTTTTLLGEIMKEAFPEVYVVGNIGIPYTGIARKATEDAVIVAEISSFQLETIHDFCPEVSAILNITPDHLDRHHTMENYIASKKDITKNQKKHHFCILNYEDDILREFGETLPVNVIYFSSHHILSHGVYFQDGKIFYSHQGEKQQICQVKELQLIGIHNYENVMAAVAMALSFGVSFEIIQKVLREFQPVEHRIEYVIQKRGVRFYNDSKGTNTDAAIQAIRAMEWPTLLIGGGYDKNSQFDSWIQSFHGKVKKLVLLGATKEKIAETAISLGFPKEDILFTEGLEEAVKVCYQNAEEGDAVLLSPACASWGMFKNYQERGNLFKEIVKKLED